MPQMAHKLTIKLQNTEYSSVYTPSGVGRYSTTCSCENCVSSFCPCPSCWGSCCSSTPCSNACWHLQSVTSSVRWQWLAPVWPCTHSSVGLCVSSFASLAGSLPASCFVTSAVSCLVTSCGSCRETSCASSSWSSRGTCPSHCLGMFSPFPCPS